jgi:hypothetical protein
MAILSASTPFLIFMNVVINGRSNKGGAIARPALTIGADPRLRTYTAALTAVGAA